ncbi:hypothetical protein HYC85_021233 [Camellia sinensis]|uniref:Uncharacterized protein n=2 Tax=Camellia TaxID=4441 RepID=A0A7J7GKY0_CAMSI|nr:hypothetical protein HYC85_021233 [Camellia sinensis]
MISPTTTSTPPPPPPSGGGGLSRQGSIAKNCCCLCSPTTHAGSFRCRLHRTPTLQRTKSMDSSASLKDSHSHSQA